MESQFERDLYSSAKSNRRKSCFGNVNNVEMNKRSIAINLGKRPAPKSILKRDYVFFILSNKFQDKVSKKVKTSPKKDHIIKEVNNLNHNILLVEKNLCRKLKREDLCKKSCLILVQQKLLDLNFLNQELTKYDEIITSNLR